MALRVGIEKRNRKGFTKDEIELTNSFAMGVMAMVTGVGNIGGEETSKYRTHISVQEAHDRFTVALEGLEFFNDQEPVKEIMTFRFVQRMANARWSCNVSNESKEEFLHKMCAHVMGDLLSRTRTETLGTHYHQIPWNDLLSRRESVRMLIGAMLSEDEDSDYYMHEMIDSINHHFDFWRDERFYGDKYLIYDEETNRFSLSDENPNEEE